MATKPVLTCTTPNGVVTRQTWRTYTQVVVLLKADGTAEGLAWSGDLRNATKQLKYWKGVLNIHPLSALASDIRIFPVDPFCTCPKCGKAVDPQKAFTDEGEDDEAGRTFYYCSEYCRETH